MQSHENLATIKSELTAAAASARGQMLFVWIDTDIEDNGRYQLVRVSKAACLFVFIVDLIFCIV